jgi:hypothetical protein
MEAAGKVFISYPSHSASIELWGVGDIHLGNPSCDQKKLASDIRTIQETPNAFWIGLGDYGDYVAPGDKRFDPSCLDREALLHVGDLGHHISQRVRKLFEPIKHKCVGLLMGNHETKYNTQFNQQSAHGWLCTELGVPNLGYCALFDIVFQKRTKQPYTLSYDRLVKRGESYGHASIQFRVCGHHGAGGSTSSGGKLNTLISLMQTFDADLFWMGHVHQRMAHPDVQIGADPSCKHIVQKVRYGCISGSYLRTYAQGICGYGEQKKYKPTTLGAARMRITPINREVLIEA